ncbi:fimbrial protein [Burkholderia sp.]|uniref:fimbrial protein n=1 Tax=Burkholderia sp. TaxID=36773 RepID=UPI0025901EC9|nr:fimbrial protein [Burkholderia sp.]
MAPQPIVISNAQMPPKATTNIAAQFQIDSRSKVPTNVFKQAGDKSTPTNFDIKLTDCDTSIAKNAYFTFTGTSSAGQPKLLATIGSATNVGIRLQAASGEYLDNGAEQKAPTVLQNGTNIARFAAMYEATAAGVTPGTADGVANFTVRYQ